MALFRYEALTVEGSLVRGVIDAETLVFAKDKLRKQQLMVRKLLAVEEKKERYCLSPPLLLTFTRDLAQLLQAGLPLYESLLTIEEKYRKHKAHYIFLDLCDKLQSGCSFSSALKSHPKSFDQIYLSMIAAAEESGALPQVLMDLAELIKRQLKLKRSLISALMYPAFLAGFCLCVVLGLLLFVVPTMSELFEERALHPMTEIVLGASAWLQHNGFSFFIVLVLFGIGLFFSFKHPKTRYRAALLMTRAPLVKTLLIQAALIRFCRALSMLLQGGVPLVPALALSKKAIGSAVIEKIISDAEKKIVEGEKLSEQLKKQTVIPPLLPRMLSIAEETGSMATMLHSVAAIYDEELERNILKLTTFLQPFLLILLGAIVGIVLLSVLLPLTDVGSFVGGI